MVSLSDRSRKTLSNAQDKQIKKKISVFSNLTNPTINIHYHLIDIFLPRFLIFENNFLHRKCCLVFCDSYVTAMHRSQGLSSCFRPRKIELNTCDLGKWLLISFNLWPHQYFTDSYVNMLILRRSSRMPQPWTSRSALYTDIKFGQKIFTLNSVFEGRLMSRGLCSVRDR